MNLHINKFEAASEIWDLIQLNCVRSEPGRDSKSAPLVLRHAYFTSDQLTGICLARAGFAGQHTADPGMGN